MTDDWQAMLFQTRGLNIQRAKTARFDFWFKDRHWRIMTELTGEGQDGSCDKGAFRLKPPAEVITPLGNKCRRGFLVCEVGPGARDLPSAPPVVFGIGVLRRAQERYGSVVNLPPRRGRGRPRKVDDSESEA